MEYKEIDVFVSPGFTDLVSLILCECGSQGSIIHDEETYDDLSASRLISRQTMLRRNRPYGNG